MSTILNEVVDGKCTIRFADNLMFEYSLEFRNAYFHTKNISEYILDFSTIRYLDSRGIGMILQMRSDVRDDCPIAITNTSDEIRDKLNELKLGKIFKLT